MTLILDNLSQALRIALIKPEDREYIVQLEENILNFLNRKELQRLYLEQDLNSYYRLLSHQVAEYYELDHVLIKQENRILLYKQPKEYTQNHNVLLKDIPIDELKDSLPASIRESIANETSIESEISELTETAKEDDSNNTLHDGQEKTRGSRFVRTRSISPNPRDFESSSYRIERAERANHRYTKTPQYPSYHYFGNNNGYDNMGNYHNYNGYSHFNDNNNFNGHGQHVSFTKPSRSNSPKTFSSDSTNDSNNFSNNGYKKQYYWNKNSSNSNNNNNNNNNNNSNNNNNNNNNNGNWKQWSRKNSKTTTNFQNQNYPAQYWDPNGGPNGAIMAGAPPPHPMYIYQPQLIPLSAGNDGPMYQDMGMIMSNPVQNGRPGSSGIIEFSQPPPPLQPFINEPYIKGNKTPPKTSRVSSAKLPPTSGSTSAPGQTTQTTSSPKPSSSQSMNNPAFSAVSSNGLPQHHPPTPYGVPVQMQFHPSNMQYPMGFPPPGSSVFQNQPPPMGMYVHAGYMPNGPNSGGNNNQNNSYTRHSRGGRQGSYQGRASRKQSFQNPKGLGIKTGQQDEDAVSLQTQENSKKDKGTVDNREQEEASL